MEAGGAEAVGGSAGGERDCDQRGAGQLPLCRPGCGGAPWGLEPGPGAGGWPLWQPGGGQPGAGGGSWGWQAPASRGQGGDPEMEGLGRSTQAF